MNAALSDLIKNVLLVVGALFPIVNPIGNTPIFLSLTRGLSERGRAALARMVAVNGLIVILASIFVGTHILAFFGISLPVVQVGGGLIVISTGWSLLRQANDDEPRFLCHQVEHGRSSRITKPELEMHFRWNLFARAMRIFESRRVFTRTPLSRRIGHGLCVITDRRGG